MNWKTYSRGKKENLLLEKSVVSMYNSIFPGKNPPLKYSTSSSNCLHLTLCGHGFKTNICAKNFCKKNVLKQDILTLLRCYVLIVLLLQWPIKIVQYNPIKKKKKKEKKIEEPTFVKYELHKLSINLRGRYRNQNQFFVIFFFFSK